jgi:uncharacterized protein involved in type VI secretion and phage assembly
MSLFEKIKEVSSAEREQKARIYGVVTGIVTNNKDDARQARVKVRFPWLADAYESHWARIAATMAGPDRGIFFLPEIDDEVLVAFENGNVTRPYIIGMLWNGKDLPPIDNSDGKNNIRQIKSRSGHTITFEDNKDEKKEKIAIKTKLGHSIELNDYNSKGKIEITTNGGNSLVLDDQNQNISLADKSGNEIILNSKDNSLKIKFTGKVTISGTGGVVIEAQDIKLGSSASSTLVNDTFFDLFNNHFHTGNMGAPTSPPMVPAIKTVNSTMFTKGA